MDHFVHCNENKSFSSLQSHNRNADLSFASPWGPLGCSVALKAIWTHGFGKTRTLATQDTGHREIARKLPGRSSESYVHS